MDGLYNIDNTITGQSTDYFDSIYTNTINDVAIDKLPYIQNLNADCQGQIDFIRNQVGTAGPTGPAGPMGPRGWTGDKGDKGNTGRSSSSHFGAIFGALGIAGSILNGVGGIVLAIQGATLQAQIIALQAQVFGLDGAVAVADSNFATTTTSISFLQSAIDGLKSFVRGMIPTPTRLSAELIDQTETLLVSNGGNRIANTQAADLEDYLAQRQIYYSTYIRS